jgi:hypothetical protein
MFATPRLRNSSTLPMLGQWDPAGIVASLVLAFGGVSVGAWGFARRDIRS